MEPNKYYNEHGVEQNTYANTNKTSIFLIPGAIVVAGALVALAVYFGGTTTPRNDGVTSTTPSNINVTGLKESDHILGSRSAPVVIIEYSDTECPFCKVFHNTLHQILSEYSGKISWVYRQFPIASLHSKAPKEAEATECVAEIGGNQAFWSYLDKIFATTNSNDSLDPSELTTLAQSIGIDSKTFDTCLSSGKYTDSIKRSLEEGYKAGVRGTPTSFVKFNKPLTSSQASALDAIALRNGLNSDGLAVSEDRLTVKIGGALPPNMMKEIVEVLLK